jgi:hypothetical protein
MLKRMLSVLVLTFTLSVVAGLAEKQGPTPDPGCYPNGCGDGGNLK